jgi:hypothetical protein
MAATPSGSCRRARETMALTGSPGMNLGISQLIVTATKNVSA